MGRGALNLITGMSLLCWYCCAAITGLSFQGFYLEVVLIASKV
jgi:hypothetical protein